MTDGSSSNGSGDSSGDGGIWRGLRSLLFRDDQNETLRDRIEHAINAAESHESSQSGLTKKDDLSPLERKMLRNILHFGQRDAGDMGVPRADIVAVEEQTSFAELLQVFAQAGHSRIPVYREKLDRVIGMIHIKDVFGVIAEGAGPPAKIADLMRQPLYVPQSMGTLDLLARMQASRTHLAIVLDEYSGTEGLITIEDLVEDIVGEIDDEHDEVPTALWEPLETGGWDADARAELEDIAAAIDPRLAEVDEDVETLGGLAFVLAGRVPEAGAFLKHESGWTLEVLEADATRVRRLRLHPAAQTEEIEE